MPAPRTERGIWDILEQKLREANEAGDRALEKRILTPPSYDVRTEAEEGPGSFAGWDLRQGPADHGAQHLFGIKTGYQGKSHEDYKRDMEERDLHGGLAGQQLRDRAYEQDDRLSNGYLKPGDVVKSRNPVNHWFYGVDKKDARMPRSPEEESWMSEAKQLIRSKLNEKK